MTLIWIAISVIFAGLVYCLWAIFEILKTLKIILDKLIK
jgi:hypothetical protein